MSYLLIQWPSDSSLPFSTFEVHYELPPTRAIRKALVADVKDEYEAASCVSRHHGIHAKIMSIKKREQKEGIAQ